MSEPPMPTTSSPAATKPLEQILRETGGESDSGLDSEDEQWTDALDSLPLTTVDSVTNPTEYPKGREPEEAFTEEEVLVRRTCVARNEFHLI